VCRELHPGRHLSLDAVLIVPPQYIHCNAGVAGDTVIYRKVGSVSSQFCSHSSPYQSCPPAAQQVAPGCHSSPRCLESNAPKYESVSRTTAAWGRHLCIHIHLQGVCLVHTALSNVFLYHHPSPCLPCATGRHSNSRIHQSFRCHWLAVVQTHL
jgi:hypothetical protein